MVNCGYNLTTFLTVSSNRTVETVVDKSHKHFSTCNKQSSYNFITLLKLKVRVDFPNCICTDLLSPNPRP